MKPRSGKFRIKPFRDQRGVALIAALGVLTIMIILGIVAISIAMNRNKMVGHDEQSTKSESVAEAGVDEVIQVTLGNFYSVYQFGVIPPASTNGDGVQVYNHKPLTNNQGATVGFYSVWTKMDPARPGNVLITSKGTDDAPQPITTTVRVSVKYYPDAFDYALIIGDNVNQPAQLQMQANGNKSDFYGKVQINGNVTQGQGENFYSLNGSADTVGYTGTFQCQCGGNMPFVQRSGPGFPKFDLSTIIKNVFTENLPSSGVPTGGWTRSGSTFTISAANFQSKYGSYDVVKLVSQSDGATVNITGPGTITSSIVVPGTPGTPVNINKLIFTGPGLTLLPKNGLAILTTEGFVDFVNGVNVGAPGQGALVYMSDQNVAGAADVTQFELQGSMTIYGSVLYQTQVQQGQFQSNGTGDMSIRYDPAFLSNPNFPGTWTLSDGSMVAVKVNFEKDPG